MNVLSHDTRTITMRSTNVPRTYTVSTGCLLLALSSRHTDLLGSCTPLATLSRSL